MTIDLTAIRATLDETQAAWLDEFFTFLRHQSVSTEAAHADDVVACCTWLKGRIEATLDGARTEVWPSPVGRHPVLYTELDAAEADRPTVLIYGHYDVQPVDPLELWESAPFEPTVRDGQVYARGAQDNKGQCFSVLQGLRLLAANGGLPVNVKWIVEGEEEAGSVSLEQLLETHRERLAADALIVVDLGFNAPDRPALTLGIRGIISMDLTVTGPNTDLHSGSHGGMVVNPNVALAKLVAGLHDDDGRVAVAGFYDEVVTFPDDQRGKLDFDFDAEAYAKTFGATAVGGESTLHPRERAWLRPTLEINGMAGGYAGDGFKTIIPSKAIAKISCRLVASQDPAVIGKRVKAHILDRAPAGVQVDVHLHGGGGPAVFSPPDRAAVQAFTAAYTEVNDTPCRYILEGGSIPIVAALAEVSGADDVVMMGYGLPTDRIHAPNEHYGIERIARGAETLAVGLDRYGRGA